jgi:hypothetical protein
MKSNSGRRPALECLEGRAIPGAVVTLPAEVFFHRPHPPNENSAVADAFYVPSPEVLAARPIVVTPSGNITGPKV